MRRKGSSTGRPAGWDAIRGRVVARRLQPEALAQAQVVAWMRFHGVLFAHPANGGARGPNAARIGAMLRRIGLARGLCDILVFDRPPARPNSVGHAFEMKAGKGRLTPEQQQWLDALQARGWEVAVYHGANEAIAGLMRLGYDRHPPSGPTETSSLV